MRRLLNLLVLTLCSGVLLPAIADGMSYPQDGQRTAQKKGAKKKPVSQAQREPKDSQAKTPRANEQRFAKNHIAVAFPRTRSLLGYLERRDTKAFDAVIEHSQKITRRLENAALQMAREHHPELSSLILRLREKHRRSYEVAIRDLVSDHQKIQRAKARGKSDYSLALKEWKLRSQARLIAARMTVQNAPELKKKLEAVLTEGEAAKRQQMQLEIQRYEEQIQKLQSRMKQDPANSVRSQIKRFQRKAQAGPKTDKRRRK